MLLSLLAAYGCGGEPPPEVAKPAPQQQAQQDGMTAEQIVRRMVEIYHETSVYADEAEYAAHFVDASDGVERQGLPVTVSVLLQRPNRFRIARVEPQQDNKFSAAVVASDGEQLEGAISEQEPQRLRLPAPQEVTLDNLAPDPVLEKALFPVPVQDMFPQLAMLLSDEEHPAWPLAARNNLVLLPAKQIRPRGGQSLACYRVQMQTTEGPQICWIQKDSFHLLRIEIPAEKLRQQLYPNQKFIRFAFRFDFFSVTLDTQLPREVFQLDGPPDGSEPQLVTKFRAADTSDQAASEAGRADLSE